MEFRKKLLILAVILLILSIVLATQYAVTKIGYHFYIMHPCDANIRYIGSDNSSDSLRILRVIGSNTTNVGVKLELGMNISTNQRYIYSAAFGIVNEENYSLNITHINVSSSTNTYMWIWLHGDRDANANSTVTDNSTVLMWGNESQQNVSNSFVWTLAPGDRNPNTMCYNTSNRASSNVDTPWDEISHVRYSLNDSNAVSGLSDFVWIQIELNIPTDVDVIGDHTGYIWIEFEADTQA